MSNFVVNRNRLINISREINIELMEYEPVNLVSELSKDIVLSLSFRTKVVGFIALQTLLRFGDLHNLDVRALAFHARQQLIQNKNGKSVVVELHIRNPKLRAMLCDLYNFGEIVNYQMLANEIKRFVLNNPLLRNSDYKKNLHIFRHLEASFMFSRDLPISLIADKLGDLEKTVKSSYIHKELLIHFS